MKTLYAACLARLGLSQAEAADYHKVRIDTIKSWASGRRNPPDQVWDELRRYEAAIVDLSETMREQWDAAPGAIEIDPQEASAMALMAAADFLLGLPEATPVAIGRSAATTLARQARRPN